MVGGDASGPLAVVGEVIEDAKVVEVVKGFHLDHLDHFDDLDYFGCLAPLISWTISLGE
jgi:hypothetical protein